VADLMRSSRATTCGGTARELHYALACFEVLVVAAWSGVATGQPVLHAAPALVGRFADLSSCSPALVGVGSRGHVALTLTTGPTRVHALGFLSVLDALGLARHLFNCWER